MRDFGDGFARKTDTTEGQYPGPDSNRHGLAAKGF
jgi:hypothetical protein